MTPSSPADPLSLLEDRLGHRFADRDRLVCALIHRSYAHERDRPSPGDNQTLEFLGDAVLDLVVSEKLLEMHPLSGEGELTRRRARLVNSASLAARARELGLDGLIRLGRGESRGGGNRKTSILGDALEAVLGALYLDAGLEPVRRLVHPWVAELPAEEGDAEAELDAKGRLQQLAQARGLGIPSYREVERTGPQHRPRFRVAVTLEDRELARGEGPSKKAAEAEAAARAREALGAGEP